MFAFIGFHEVIVCVCLFQLVAVAGQKYTLHPVEHTNDCTTALISVEVETIGSFNFSWFVIHENVRTEIAVVLLSQTGKIRYVQVDNKFFSPDVYSLSHSPESLPLSALRNNRFTSTLVVTNLDVNKIVEFGAGGGYPRASVNVSAPFCNVEDQYCQNTPAKSKIICGSIFLKQPISIDQYPIHVKCLVNGSLNTSAMCLPAFHKSSVITTAMSNPISIDFSSIFNVDNATNQKKITLVCWYVVLLAFFAAGIFGCAALVLKRKQRREFSDTEQNNQNRLSYTDSKTAFLQQRYRSFYLQKKLNFC